MERGDEAATSRGQSRCRSGSGSGSTGSATREDERNGARKANALWSSAVDCTVHATLTE